MEGHTSWQMYGKTINAIVSDLGMLLNALKITESQRESNRQ